MLVTGSLAHDVETAWSKTLSEMLKTGPADERMVSRLADPVKDEGSQASDIQRGLFESFCCPEQLRKNAETGDIAAVQLLRHVRRLHFDYEAQSSRDQGRALADCQNILASGDSADAASLWNRLIGFAAERRVAGGSVDFPELLAGLRGEFQLRDYPDYRKDWEALTRRSREAMDDVRTEIAGLPSLARGNENAIIAYRLSHIGVCFLAGESGSGKLVLAKQTAKARYKRTVWATEETKGLRTCPSR